MIGMRKTPKELRKFGLTMAIAFCLFGALFFWRDKPIWPYLFGIGGLFLISGLILPSVLAPIEWVWMKMAHVLGQIMTRIILTLTYYIVITPISLVMRLVGRDPLLRTFDKTKASYWVPVDPEGPTGRPDKPY